MLAWISNVMPSWSMLTRVVFASVVLEPITCPRSSSVSVTTRTSFQVPGFAASPGMKLCHRAGRIGRLARRKRGGHGEGQHKGNDRAGWTIHVRYYNVARRLRATRRDGLAAHATKNRPVRLQRSCRRFGQPGRSPLCATYRLRGPRAARSCGITPLYRIQWHLTVGYSIQQPKRMVRFADSTRRNQSMTSSVTVEFGVVPPWPHRHLLGIEQLSAAEITLILDTAERFRKATAARRSSRAAFSGQDLPPICSSKTPPARGIASRWPQGG